MAAGRSIINTPEDQALKARCRELNSAVGGVENGATMCRVGKSLLSDYGNPNTDVFMPVDVLKDLESNAHGTPHYPQVTRWLARKAGFALVAMPEVGELTTAKLTAALAEATREHGDITHGLLEALSDNDVSEAEADRLAIEALQSAEAAMRLHALLLQRAGKA